MAWNEKTSRSPSHTSRQMSLLEPKPCTKTAGAPTPPVLTARQPESNVFIPTFEPYAYCGSRKFDPAGFAPAWDVGRQPWPEMTKKRSDTKGLKAILGGLHHRYARIWVFGSDRRSP